MPASALPVEILQIGPYPDWDQIPLDAAFTMHRYFEAQDKAGFLASVAPEVRGIATRGELGAGRAMIEALPKLEVISVYGVGYDAVDLAACRERGIRVTNTPDVLTKDVADLGVCDDDGAVARHDWRGEMGARRFLGSQGALPLEAPCVWQEGRRARARPHRLRGGEAPVRVRHGYRLLRCDGQGLCTGLALHRRSGGPGAARRLPFRDTRRLRANPPHRWPRGDRGGGAGGHDHQHFAVRPTSTRRRFSMRWSRGAWDRRRSMSSRGSRSSIRGSWR